MKLLKTLTAFLLLAALQIAAAQWLHVPPPVEAKNLMMFTAGVPVTAITYLVHETFDGANRCWDGWSSNCDTADVWNPTAGSPTFNSTTVVLQGTYTLQFTEASTKQIQRDFTSTDSKIYTSFIFEPTAHGGSDSNIIILFNSDGTYLGMVRFDLDVDHYHFRFFYNGIGSGVTDTQVITLGEKWYLKIEYTKGTGANAAWDFYAVKDSTGFPGWGSSLLHITDSSDAKQFNRIAFTAYGGSTFYFDDIRVSTTDPTYP